MDFEKGNIYQVKGVNGKGKSTFINLLIGLYSNNYSGDIFYNDINVTNINMLEFREKYLSFTGQTNYIFNGTVQQNILLVSKKIINLIYM